jgi:hypothetical protein
MLGLGFAFGFFSQCNLLIGGSGDGATATGGYGYRVGDFLCVVAIVLLGVRSLDPRRLVPLGIFSLIVAALCFVRYLEPTFLDDPRTFILALHYLGYTFAGLSLALILERADARDGFCWGLTLGLLSTVPIFVLQDTGFASTLVNLGLIPGYYAVLHLDIGETSRYSGLWGHPNEAGLVAALAAPGAAYLFFSQRRVLPLALAGGALVAVFYYTQSRGGLIAGGGILAISLLWGRQGRIHILRLVLVGAALWIAVGLLSQIDFIASRFADPGTQGNFTDRLNSILFGLDIVLTHPFGMSMTDFASIMAAGTGGVATPHNGFIFFAAIFGWVPLAVLIAALVRNLSIRSDTDALFAIISLGFIFTCMFEQVPGSYPFVFVLCMIVGRAFITTPIGRGLSAPTAQHRSSVFASGAGSRLRTTGMARR